MVWRNVFVTMMFVSISAFTVASTPDAYAACIACHGVNGEGNPALKAPALAGQLPDYIVRQITNFQQGHRGTAAGDILGAQMVAFASLLTEPADIDVIAQYLSELPVSARAVSIEGDVVAGKSLYNSNCGDCHGANGLGNDQFSAPMLAGLTDQYLFDQFNKFKSSQRGFAKEDKRGRQMQFMSDEIANDEALRNVVAYIQTLVER
jgi:cytochrome c oxidase subunit 2